MIATIYAKQQEESEKNQNNMKHNEIIDRTSRGKVLAIPGLQLRAWHLPAGHIGRPGTKMSKILGVTIHDTGNQSKGSNALANCKYVHKHCTKKKVSFHYAVDDKGAIELLPVNEVGYHASNRVGNTQTVGIEICIANDIDWVKSHDNAAILTAMILRKVMKIPPGTDITPYLFTHYYWIRYGNVKTGKICPRQMLVEGRPYSWEVFVAKVNKFFIG